MVFNRVPRKVTLGQQYNVGEKPTVILYTYINPHAELPNITKQDNIVLSQEDSTWYLIVVPSDLTRIGARVKTVKFTNILYTCINRHARISEINQRGLQPNVRHYI